jgi:hypothetical protein
MNRTATTLAAAAFALSACAPSPDSIAASSVSPALYSGQSCAALNAEALRVNDRLADMTGRQARASSSDATMTAVSLILFWPAAFFIGSQGDHASDIARLRGEAEAIAAAARSRGC